MRLPLFPLCPFGAQPGCMQNGVGATAYFPTFFLTNFNAGGGMERETAATKGTGTKYMQKRVVVVGNTVFASSQGRPCGKFVLANLLQSSPFFFHFLLFFVITFGASLPLCCEKEEGEKTQLITFPTRERKKRRMYY